LTTTIDYKRRHYLEQADWLLSLEPFIDRALLNYLIVKRAEHLESICDDNFIYESFIAYIERQLPPK